MGFPLVTCKHSYCRLQTSIHFYVCNLRAQEREKKVGAAMREEEDGDAPSGCVSSLPSWRWHVWQHQQSAYSRKKMTWKCFNQSNQHNKILYYSTCVAADAQWNILMSIHICGDFSSPYVDIFFKAWLKLIHQSQRAQLKNSSLENEFVVQGWNEIAFSKEEVVSRSSFWLPWLASSFYIRVTKLDWSTDRELSATAALVKLEKVLINGHRAVAANRTSFYIVCLSTKVNQIFAPRAS